MILGLIYYIGYKLRAGESEWNELHIVDIFPQGNNAELRGRTYVSAYSPVNARFPLASDQPFATLRGESQGNWGGGQESTRASVEHRGNGFRADILVPVWTSQLFVNDWWQPSALPLGAQLIRSDGSLRLAVTNYLPHKLTEICLVTSKQIYRLGSIEPQAKRTFELAPSQATELRQFVQQYAQQFQYASQQRNQAFGGDQHTRIWDLPLNTIAACLVSQMNQLNPVTQGSYPGMVPGNYNFTSPAGLDLTSILQHGHAVLLAWQGGESLTRPINQFTPRRSQRDTLLRLAIPLSDPL